MPYYRILIWTKKRSVPYKGIRLIANPNINAVHQQMEVLAKEKYRKDFIDIEVQMLSKLSTAIKEFQKKENKT